MSDFYNSAMQILKSKKHKGFVIGKEIKSFQNVTGGELPTSEETFAVISVGGFSSVAIITEIARQEKIKRCYCSTFRIGKKQFRVLQSLHENQKLDYAEFYTSNLQANSDSKRAKYNYIDFINKTALKNGWVVKAVKNHSKIILCETEQGNFYVVEASSNLNENPQIEHFSVSNDRFLFEFYEHNLFGLLRDV